MCLFFRAEKIYEGKCIIMQKFDLPKGFLGAGEHIGIKKAKKDLALLYSKTDCVMSARFTTNVVKAAPVLWDMDIYNSKKTVRGIVINSGNANACTGEQGKADTRTMARNFADAVGVSETEILVCSTGVIGFKLPMEEVSAGIKSVAPNLSEDGGLLAAEAIMTTDTFMKTKVVEVNISGETVKISGMAKGSGMIHPNMATMLAFVMTDACISSELLDKALGECVDLTFNQCSVDGDTSTNDTILVLANGQAENSEVVFESEDYITFKNGLMDVCKSLAVDVVRDGEGATKLMEVTVSGAASEKDARIISRSVVSSNLFKAALFGSDANWGRVLCAMGYSGAQFDPERVNMSFRSISGEMMLFKSGTPVGFDEDIAKKILSEKDIFIDIDLSMGEHSAKAWGCDLTYDYVKINGDYRS